MKPKNKYSKEKGTDFEKRKRECPHCHSVLKKIHVYRKNYTHGVSSRPKYDFKHTKFCCVNKSCNFRKNTKFAYKEFDLDKIIYADDRKE